MTVEKTQENLSTTLSKTEQSLNGLETTLDNNVGESREANNGLPEGWADCKLMELGEIVTGNTPSKKNPEYYGGKFPIFKPGDLGSSKGISEASEYLSETGKQVSRFIPAFSTYVTCIGATISKTGYSTVDGTCNQQINAITSNCYVNARWLYFLMVSPSIKNKIITSASNTTLPILNKSRFSDLQAVLPPLAEQTVIAQTLDTLLAQVDNIKTRLDAIPKILKTFRQSVLAAAVSGKLTEEWRGENECEDIRSLIDRNAAKKNGKLKVRKNSGWDQDLDLACLPTGWDWIENHKLAIDSNTAICAGPFGTIFKAKDFRDSGVPIIFLRHVKEGGFNQRKPNYMDTGVWKENHQEYSVYGGELLVAKLGEPPGESCIFPSDFGTAMVTPDVLKMNVDSEVADIKYLMSFFNSPISKKMIGDAAFGATRLRIDIALFKCFPIPLPPREEQTQIIQRLEELFAFADQIEQQVKNAQGRVNNLTQSILAKAFRGELTAQWRADNPDLISGENSAEALLAKIKEEREALKQKAKPKKKSTRKKSVNK